MPSRTNSRCIHGRCNEAFGDSKVLDVKGGEPTIHAALQIYEHHVPYTQNQFWQFTPHWSQNGYYIIQSALGDNLVVDVRGDNPDNTTRGLQVYPQNGGSNQLWKAVPGPNFSTSRNSFYIQSAMGDNLVATVGASEGNPPNFVGVAAKEPSGANQLFALGTVGGNKFDPVVNDPQNDGNTFSISGGGFMPACPLELTWFYSDNPYTTNPNVVTLITDFAGTFQSGNYSLSGLPGLSDGATMTVSVAQPNAGQQFAVTFNFTYLSYQWLETPAPAIRKGEAHMPGHARGLSPSRAARRS